MSILYLSVRRLRYNPASCADLKISYVGALPWNSICCVCLNGQPVDFNVLIISHNQRADSWYLHLIFTAFDYSDQFTDSVPTISVTDAVSSLYHVSHSYLINHTPM